MITPFIEVLEKIIELFRQERVEREKLFHQVIEPLFNNLQNVVNDYFKLFFTAKSLLDANSERLMKDAVNELKAARENLLSTRIMVREMANAITEFNDNKRIKHFVTNIHSFFFSSQLENKEKKISSRGAKLIELFDYVLLENISRSDLIDYINSTLINLENSWMSIAQSYASVQVYYLSSIWKKKGNADYIKNGNSG